MFITAVRKKGLPANGKPFWIIKNVFHAVRTREGFGYSFHKNGKRMTESAMISTSIPSIIKARPHQPSCNT